MIVRVKLFASAREIAGTGSVDLRLPPSATLGQLREGLAESCPPLRGLPGRWAVNREFAVSDDVRIHPGDEVAWIPPVSGG